MLTWAFVSTSCSDYLDKTPDDATSITLEEVFSSEIYTERFLLRAYDYLPCETNYNDNDYWALGAWSGASDEMNITWTYPMAKEMNRGSWNPKMLEGSSSQGTSYAMWWRYYEGIRQCNVFLENIDLCPAAQATKNVWICEARFMRAMLHFFLLRSHGPIPIMDHALKMDDEMTYFPRNTFDQCVDFIVSDCQYGIDGALPMIYTNASGTVAESLYGRATKAAAYALKARVLLYAASPLFNGNADYAKFANEDGTLLFAPKDDSKWGKAAAAAKEAIDKIEGSSYYGLYYSDEPDNGYRNYMELFLPSKKWNKEYIFARNQGTGYSDNIHQEKCMAANGMGGWSGLCPTQELVDAYEMANGSTPIIGYNADGTPIINGASGYSETGFAATAGKHYPAGVYNMYVGREPRFYAAFTFQNRRWDLDDKLVYYTDFSLNGNSGQAKNGHDYPRSGVLVRKKRTNVSGVNYYVYIRLSEIYLNYAEACCELDDIGTAINYVNKIRLRAGIPEYKGLLAEDLTPTDKRGFERITLDSYDKEFVKKVIYRERLLELSYENHHYFDVRRWGVADMATGDGWIYPSWHNGGEGGDMVGFDVTVDMASDDAKDPLLFYKRKVWETRVYSKRMSLFPIPQTEINRNARIVQNTGWETEM